MYKTIVP